ncbi:SRPBCC family protein [Azospirillum rugosum]|uniref:NADPH:quinone reductase-like Zn-dependent oxidoreductase n=1 Tax=Azospirillum rugosum TaxID=416170 RepID=A0ABS4SFN2_9PROT|nr:SRPBCC family protein [Azospirillum rugosum]MBP2291230.1 NADPH:quinone reductase-like Zn-dependent oxidoreductase [Azospirillum rugosum]MDQ0524706.1 NADPH:quinone reductase-like Zn-dependent oxidoreductase [Azospirillum rugosum]
MPRVVRSTVIDAPVAEVWRILRDFNSHRDWHPAVADSVIEDGQAPDSVGAVRRFRLTGGAVLREQLLSLSDRDFTLSYCILDAPLPLFGYVAHIRLKPVTDGNRTFWTWTSDFDCPPEREAEMVRLVAEGVYEAGFAGMAKALRRGRGPLPNPPPLRGGGDGGTLSRNAGEGWGGGMCDAIVARAYGPPDVLQWTRVAVPPPGPGEVTVRHTAIGVNFIDVYCRTGYFRLLQPPGVPGMEGVGVIDSIGPGVTGLSPGDRVGYACAPVGAYAERRTMPAELLVSLPDDIDDETAAATLLKGMTAEFLLHRVHPLAAGETAVVHAAAGGVGVLLCQWAGALGATVIGVVGSEAKARIARAQGCAHVVLTTDDVPGRVLELTGGRGADVVYDAVGRDSLARDLAMLAPCGHIVSYGQAGGHLEPLDVASLAERSARLSRPNFGHYAGTPAQVRLSSQRLFDALRRGLVRPFVGARFPLREAAQAHRRLEDRASVGATILFP